VGPPKMGKSPQIWKSREIWGLLPIFGVARCTPTSIFWALPLTPITSIPKISVSTYFYTYVFTGIQVDGAARSKGLTIEYKAHSWPNPCHNLRTNDNTSPIYLFRLLSLLPSSRWYKGLNLWLVNSQLHNQTSHRQVHQARTHIDNIQPHTK